jgi:hypothetical protein
LARLDESIAAFNQRFIFPLPFAMINKNKPLEPGYAMGSLSKD